jgi:hypothetical protein
MPINAQEMSIKVLIITGKGLIMQIMRHPNAKKSLNYVKKGYEKGLCSAQKGRIMRAKCR